MSILRLSALSAAVFLIPGVGQAAAMTPTDILFNAAPTMKILSGPRLTGGSAFLQALRLGGPLIGLLGAAWNVLLITIAIANIGQQPSYPVLAPGVAESIFLFVLGLTTGVVAVICNWVVEARIDRAVLRP